jgi:energy-coupling factor transporter ATP-binding protein EcfA2
MSVQSIRLRDFRRFKRNEVSTFNLDIDSPIVTLLGRNGSGKTSLLKLLTGRSPTNKEFLKTGSFEIEHLYKGKHYTLKGIFHPSPKYYFKVDHEVLNDWGTITTQNQLVNTHFGVDRDVHNLLIGAERFHAMSAPKRKDWLVRLCSTSYDYAIERYNKIKDRHRDVSGALKVAKQRLASELQKKLHANEVVELTQQVNMLHDLVQTLSEGRIPVTELTRDHGKDGLLALLGKFESIGGYQERWPAAKLKETADAAKVKQQFCQNTIARVGKEMQALASAIELLQKAERKTIDDLDLEVIGLKAKLGELENLIYRGELLKDAAVDQVTWETVRPEIMEIMDTIPDNDAGNYSSNALVRTRERIAVAKTREMVLQRQAAVQGAKLAHLEEHKDVKDTACPKCKHRFSLVYNEEHYEIIKRALSRLQKEMRENAELLKTLLQEEETCAEYGTIYRRYVRLTNRHIGFGVYWDRLQDLRAIAMNPKQHRGLDEIDQQIAAQVLHQATTTQVKEKELLIKTLRNAGQGGDLARMLTKQEELEAELNGQIDLIEGLKSIEQHYRQQHRQRQQVDALLVKIKNYMAALETQTTEEIEQLRRTHYNEALRDIQSLLASKADRLHQDKLQERSVKVYQEQIADLAKEEQAFLALMKALSPSEGLIAEGLFGFIDQLTQGINSIVEQVWSYPMEIRLDRPTGDSVDLDYNFPVYLEDEEEQTTSDVSELSKGQKEMFDLAFLITAMVYMEMTEMPLLLDEIGSSFDPDHRVTLVNLMKSLVESRSFDQIVLVSHYQQQYLSLSAQVVELSSVVS